MKKKGILIWPVMMASLIFSQTIPCTVLATEDEYVESYEDTDEETEPPIPESYYWTIESNDTDGWPQGPQIEAEAAAVMDADTGAFLYSKNMYAKEYPASTTKIMTALLAIEYGDLKSKITFSENAVYNLEEGSSHAGIQVGEVMRMSRALYGLMLESANDIANGIAETVGGSLEGFADMMNAKAEELGCVNTHFVNPHGLHNEDHYTCAHDLALITQEAISLPAFRKIAGTENYTCPETNMVDEKRYWYNHNQMIHPDAEYYYEDCLGGKTGFTSDAWNTLVTYAERDGRTLICVELRVNGKEKAYSESAKMLDYAFENFRNVTVSLEGMDKTRAELIGMDYLGQLSLLRTDELDVPVMDGSSQILVTIPKDADASQIQKSGDGNGGLTYTYNGWQVGKADLSFSSLNFEVPTPKTVPLTYSEIQEETEPGVKGVIQVAVRKTKSFGKTAGKEIQKFMEKIPGWLAMAQEKFWDLVDWINENDIMAALVGLILLVILVPILVVAWTRNSKAQKIRKRRKKEREERTRIEQNIDRKSVSEIEAELRAEIEKDRQERQQAVEAAREMHVEEEKKEESE